MGITEEKIGRINELARKAKAEGLTNAERMEQAALREEYIQAIRGNLKSQLDSIRVVSPDGSIRDLGAEHRKKYGDGKEGN